MSKVWFTDPSANCQSSVFYSHLHISSVFLGKVRYVHIISPKIFLNFECIKINKDDEWKSVTWRNRTVVPKWVSERQNIDFCCPLRVENINITYTWRSWTAVRLKTQCHRDKTVFAILPQDGNTPQAQKAIRAAVFFGWPAVKSCLLSDWNVCYQRPKSILAS